jgi:hypothetical protein
LRTVALFGRAKRALIAIIAVRNDTFYRQIQLRWCI